MGKKYNYYDTPSNHPESVKYRKWESAILIFGIGVVSTLLLLHYLFGSIEQSPAQTEPAVIKISPDTTVPACDNVRQMHTAERDRLIQLLDLANDLPIADVSVMEYGRICYDEDRNPIADVATDIYVTVDYIEASRQSDYRMLGHHVSEILPSVMQIQVDNPRNVTIRFLIDETYLEWSHPYSKVNLFTQGMRGEALWFWVAPDYD